MPDLKRRRKVGFKRRCLKQILYFAKKAKHSKKIAAALRLKNNTLVCELQKERMKTSALYKEYNFLQCENFQAMHNLVANQGNFAVFKAQTAEVEQCVQNLAGMMVQGSTMLAQISVSCNKMKAQFHNPEDQPSDGRNGSPVSSRQPSLTKERRKLKTQDALKDNLDVIEEVSHENSISPNSQLIASTSSGTRYERRCKKGMRLLLSTRNRKSAARKSIKSNSSNNGDSLNRKSSQKTDEGPLDISDDDVVDQSKLDVLQESLDGSRLDESDERTDGSKLNQSDEAVDKSKLDETDKTADESKSDMSIEASEKLSDAEASDKVSLDASSREPSPSNQNSSSIHYSSRSSGCSGKSLRYSDVLKSANSSQLNESNGSVNLSKNETVRSLAETSVSPLSNLERTNLESPEERKPDISSLSSITVRRGTSRQMSTSELVKNDLGSCNATPKRNLKLENSNIRASQDSEGNRSTASANSITYRRHYKQRESFTFYAVPEWSNSSKRRSTHNSTIKATSNNKESVNDSTLKPAKLDKENEEPNETVVPKTKEKKKGRKPKKVSADSNVDYNLNNSYHLFADENSRISGKRSSGGKNLNATSSTPLESVKSGKNRQPLETLASSTRMSANESKLSNCKWNRFYGLSETALSLSPILNLPKHQESVPVDETGLLTFDNSSTINNDSSGSQRPRRNAAKNKNYKEPPLSKKLRRNN